MINHILVNTKIAVRNALILLVRLVGIRLFNLNQTITFLTDSQRAYEPEYQLSLPDVFDAIDPDKQVFKRPEAVTLPTYAWQYTPRPASAALLPSGCLFAEGQVLCTDYWNYQAIKHRLRPPKRQTVQTDLLVAPFSHQQDMIAFGGYYDYLFLIAAKLCRLQQAMPEVSFADAAVAYPLFGTSYEQEFLTLMGFRPERILDSRQHDVTFTSCLLGSGGDWFYPSPADIRALQMRLTPLVHNPDKKREPTYISRAGRRRVVNEDALVRMLETYGFRIVEDKPRTLAEQLSIYNQASFVIGPHGASFSNILWCEPGTHLFELFAPDYAPPFFLYLAQLLGLRYSAAYQKRPDQNPVNAIEANMRVSIPDLERKLNQVFESDFR
ncbi:glycosyltransferase family 61 protein [Spirosoma taeanense]|uniref:Glycosyltransferase family 61 protein n=1 Tax=Spirosoma taeanense TaxID=2735870 RepID=A0A6M5Y731_9BACT|nr:glycosyltransferase family 61 protein [Spirosoma taeanense]QJW90197.1 glycosyltransferase family 61 protein [Spirosoma taeanense]